jgi:hypothetical protein
MTPPRLTLCAFPSPDGSVLVQVFQNARRVACGEFDVSALMWKRVGAGLGAVKGVEVWDYPTRSAVATTCQYR